jgi:hypothetical protein
MLTARELDRITSSIPAQPVPAMTPQGAVPSGAGRGYIYPPDYVDCDNPYFSQYCKSYSTWSGSFGLYYYGQNYPYPVNVGFVRRELVRRGSSPGMTALTIGGAAERQ